MKFTAEQIEKELAALENSEAQAACHYLKQELRRRKGAGRKPSGTTRREQNRTAQQRFRDKGKRTFGNPVKRGAEIPLKKDTNRRSK